MNTLFPPNALEDGLFFALYYLYNPLVTGTTVNNLESGYIILTLRATLSLFLNFNIFSLI